MLIGLEAIALLERVVAFSRSPSRGVSFPVLITGVLMLEGSFESKPSLNKTKKNNTLDLKLLSYQILLNWFKCECVFSCGTWDRAENLTDFSLGNGCPVIASRLQKLFYFNYFNLLDVISDHYIISSG